MAEIEDIGAGDATREVEAIDVDVDVDIDNGCG